MFYKLDKEGNYVGVKSAENKNWDFQTEIDIPDGMIKPKLVNEVWIEGGEPIKEDIPNEVPLWCIKAILNEMGLLEIVESALTQLEEPLKSRANYIWNYGNIIKRDSLTVAFIGQVLQKSKIEIDEIFINADKLEL